LFIYLLRTLRYKCNMKRKPVDLFLKVLGQVKISCIRNFGVGLTTSMVWSSRGAGSRFACQFSVFYGTGRFITVVTRARHRSLSWAGRIHSTPSHRSVSIVLSSHLTPVSTKWSLPFRFPVKFYSNFLFPTCVLLAPPISFSMISLPTLYLMKSSVCMSSLMQFFQPPPVSSILDLNIVLPPPPNSQAPSIRILLSGGRAIFTPL